MEQNRSLSVRFDEIEYQWSMIHVLYALKLPLYEYKKGQADRSKRKRLWVKK